MRANLALALSLLLVACSGGASVYYSDYGRYSGSTAAYAARDGQMPLAIYGNPTNASQSNFNHAVAMALAGTHVTSGVVFVPADAPIAEGYRTVIVFGGSARESICSPRPIATAGGSAGPMAAAFCLDEEPLSFAVGSMPAPSGLDDPNMRQHLAAIGAALFPRENPNHADRCRLSSLECK